VTTALTILSTLLWWVLYSSVVALAAAGIGWCVLRWAERGGVVFNRLYLACLLWSLVGLGLIAIAAAVEGHLQPPYGALLRSGLLRWMLVLNMLIGAVLVWRLTPRIDAHRVRLGSACMAVAMVTAVGFGIATTLA